MPEPRPDLHTTSLLSLARAVRDFGDGFAAVLLPVHLIALGLGPWEIGVVATAALLGSSFYTLLIGAYGNRFGERSILLAASLLMTATGIGFALAPSYGVVAAVAFCGTLNPAVGNASIFFPSEHSLLSRSVEPAARTAAFARYGLIGALAAAVGALASASPDLLVRFGVTQPEAIRAMFVVYAGLGLVAGAVYLRLSRADHAEQQKAATPLGPSRGIVLKLAALFSLDSFGSGLIVQSLLALYLFERFGLSLASAGLFFFWSSVLTAFSQPLAAWLAGRIGLVNTMVFTHIPANLLLIIGALVPSLPVALGCLLARAFLSQMDVPARSSYVMAVVTPPERTAAASFTAVPRSLASALSPALSGVLIATGHLAWPLVLGGALKIVYDLLLLYAFSHIKPPEEQSGAETVKASLRTCARIRMICGGLCTSPSEFGKAIFSPRTERYRTCV